MNTPVDNNYNHRDKRARGRETKYKLFEMIAESHGRGVTAAQVAEATNSDYSSIARKLQNLVKNKELTRIFSDMEDNYRYYFPGGGEIPVYYVNPVTGTAKYQCSLKEFIPKVWDKETANTREGANALEYMFAAIRNPEKKPELIKAIREFEPWENLELSLLSAACIKLSLDILLSDDVSWERLITEIGDEDICIALANFGDFKLSQQN